MAKLYPPFIEGTIPAFTGTTLVVPFSMNKAVGASEVKAFQLNVKRVNSNESIYSQKTEHFDINNNFTATFTIDKELFKCGQFYRIQLAYVDVNDEVGFFSTIGVVKYTSKPKVEIINLDPLNSNLHTYEYTLRYGQEEDQTEKLYSSRFLLLDADDNIVKDSGELIHNSATDLSPKEAIEKYNIYRDLEANVLYRMKAVVKTINGLTVETPRYRLVQRENSSTAMDEIGKIILKATALPDEGRVKISLSQAQEDHPTITGVFILYRAFNKKPYLWEKICQFSARQEVINGIYKIDKMVQQGQEYIYSIQQKNNYNMLSRRGYSNVVSVDFEDMFLMDKERCLNIRFNPKVSSFKETVLESKTNTIGSQFPYITRNAHVRYKEFSISGLISHLMDVNKEFMSWADLGLEHYITDLVSENIRGERIFRTEVLNWLNDGKPKVFKSPTEGGFIVRLMNISLTPVDTVGRMIYTFNASAVEIAPFDYEHLLKYNFIDLEAVMSNVPKLSSIPFAYTDANGRPAIRSGELLNGQELYSVEVSGLAPGSTFEMNGEVYAVGVTGAYRARMEAPVYSFKLPNNPGDGYINGVLTAEFRGQLESNFDKVRGMKMIENPARQFIGNKYWYWTDQKINLIEHLTDVKTKLVAIPRITFYKRAIHPIYVEYNGTTEGFNATSIFYSVGNSTASQHRINLKDLDQLSLYEVRYSSVGCTILDNGMYEKNGKQFSPNSGKVIDIMWRSSGQYTFLSIANNFSLFNINVNGSVFNIADDLDEKMTLKNMVFDYVSIGDGIIAEAEIAQQVIEYAYETEDAEIRQLYNNYQTLLDKYQKKVIDTNANADLELKDDLYTLKYAYEKLVNALTERILLEFDMEG